MEETIINGSGSYTFTGDAVSCCGCYVIRYVAYRGAPTIYEREGLYLTKRGVQRKIEFKIKPYESIFLKIVHNSYLTQ